MVMDGRAVTRTDRAARRLRRDLLVRLNDEVARRRLENPQPIPVRWSRTGRPVQSPDDVLGTAGLGKDGDVEDVPAFLKSLPKRQLVVLGAPGSGKSVCALLLARELLDSWQPEEPVPVLLSLSSWRPSVPLRTWLVRHIRQLSPGLGRGRLFRRDVARRLFDERRVMPVLDGLDELPEPLHRRAVEAIEALGAKRVPLLLTCRATEYEKVGDYLTKAAVVELEPVATGDAVTYLRGASADRGERWGTVFAALRKRPRSPLGRTLSTPLMLHMAATAYRAGSTDPGELLRGEEFRTRAGIEAHLLARYLPTLYAESSETAYGADEAQRYLAFVARRMHGDGTSDFAWWQVSSGVAGLLVGVAYGAVWGWFFYLLFGTLVGVMAGVIAGGCGIWAYAMVRGERRQVYIAKDALHGPRALLFRYAGVGVLAMLVTAALAGGGMSWWLRATFHLPVPEVMPYALLMGAGMGLAALLGSAWGSFQVSRTWLWMTGRLPWRLMKFLDDAHHVGVLRQTGAVYQFQHVRLQEQLSGEAGEPGPSEWSRRKAISVLDVEWPWRSKWLLPLVPTAAQFGFALGGLTVVAMINYLATSSVTLLYRSGAKPAESALVYCTGGGGNPAQDQSCTSIPVLTWTVRGRPAEAAVLRAAKSDVSASVAGVGGSLKAEGCAKAVVRAEWSVGGRVLRSVVLKNGEDLSEERMRVPHAVPYEGEPVSLALRRVDGETCDVKVAWTNPGLVTDIYRHARARFGEPAQG
ncbi:hypothetical protein GCM10010218_13820 [Streptomyces mashuensis]|uniref:NACHT domain-containing protein n=2 Tax=Streptomyces mashuensis TaxID=33904 RepID=A0A919EC36_9ACTN|nr:hypothetical protein GCM10010218_13820 [Streptomyces mashuensis]